LTAVAARTETGVVVLGMHRSGTSAATRAINMLGVPICRSDDLWLELPGNPTGYWESASLSRFDEGLLRRIGSAWWCPPGPGEIDPLRHDDGLRAEALELFGSLHETPSWVWKDPRACATLPFWRSVLDARLCGMLVLRNPLEVAASLRMRDGISTAWALALWERYLRLALHAAAGLPILVTEYAQLVDEPAVWSGEVAAYLADRGLPVADSAEIASFLDPDLRHSTYGDGDLFSSPDVTTEQRELHFAARELAGVWDAFEPPTLPRESVNTQRLLDTLRRTFPLDHLPTADAVGRAFGGQQPDSDESERAMTSIDVAQTVSTNGSLLPEWREWLAENLLLQVPREEIVKTLVDSGITEQAANSEIESVLADACWRAGDRAAQRLRKLESVIDVHQQLDALDDQAFTLDRTRWLSRWDFLERYYARNRPVLILGLTDGWPAHDEWTLDRLKARLGHVEVEVQSGRDRDEQYELHSNLHKSQMSFGDYIDRIQSGGVGNDLYLTANNHFFEREDTAVLLNDFTMPTEYLDPDPAPGTFFFWFGPGGTVTPFHHDVCNVLFVQVIGRKRIVLIPALQTHRLYNDVGVYSSVDLLRPDYDRFPRFQETTPIEVVVEPGETLFIPVGWWHYVEALDTSVSLSFTNFVFPNGYDWEHPQIDR
jgi:hypothetical protein